MAAVKDGQSGVGLFSQSWYRVSALRPRLKAHVEVHRHTYRGRDWHVLQDHASGKFQRISPEAYLIVGLMDGRRTVGEIWEAVCAQLGEDMPTQDEVISLLAHLHKTDALQSDLPPDTEDLRERSEKEKKNRWFANLKSPAAMRFPLIDPEKFLEATIPLVGLAFTWVGGLIWLAAVAWAFAMAGVHWDELSTDVTDRVLSAQNLMLLWLVYPVVKTLHEFGHAYAVKKWGGEVHEMGVMFLVFVPIPYVDASASLAFREKWRRILVGAAGIMAELAVSAVAMLVWVNSEPGTVRAVSYNVMLVAGISTVLINGNPLVRYDAYYILSDFLEIPNLGLRGQAYLGYLAKRWYLRIKDAVTPAASGGEALWLFAYAVTSFFYRIFIWTAIVIFIAQKFFIVGIILALWSAAGILVFPIWRVVRTVSSDPSLKRQTPKIALGAGALAAGLAAILLWLPLPYYTVAEGVVWVPEDSRVYAGADSFLTKVVAEPGGEVKKGQPLLVCEYPKLGTDTGVQRARVGEMEARRAASLVNNRTEAALLQEEINRARAELYRASEREGELVIKSPGAGTFLLQQPEDMPGRFLKQGSPVAYVVDFSRVIVRVVVDQDDVDFVRNAFKVEARLSERFDTVYTGKIEREVPAATKDLPSLALALEGGGNIALDPQEGKQGKAFEKYFSFDVLLANAAVERVGERVYLRFEHEPEPVGYRVYRHLRRLFMKRFGV